MKQMPFKMNKKELTRLLDLVKCFQEIANIYYAEMEVDIIPVRLERYGKIGECLDEFKEKWGE